MPKPMDPIEYGLKNNDPRPLAELDLQHLEKLRLAEEILEARFHAKKRASRIAVVSGAMVGYVALAGFFANAYQNYMNKKHLEEQAGREEVKWQQEFERGQKADKYKAFFEVSSLVTDGSNPERRLTGYALMDEFVSDRDYHPKAVAILQQALNRELRESASENLADGMSKDHEIAVAQIIHAMSASTSCHEFELAADSIKGVVQHARNADFPEARDLFLLYARRLVGRATLVCKNMEDFDDVRQPIREALKRLPSVAGTPKNATRADTNFGIAKLLVEACVEEQEDLGSQECLDIRSKYLKLCREEQKNKGEPKDKEVGWKYESKACDAIAAWPEPPPVPVQAAAVPAKE